MTIGFGRQGHSNDHHKLAPAPTAGLPYEMTLDKLPNHIGGWFQNCRTSQIVSHRTNDKGDDH